MMRWGTSLVNISDAADGKTFPPKISPRVKTPPFLIK
jgi:hypothetical protein